MVTYSRLAILIAAVVFAGCLPGSGRRAERAMTPADSASVRLAADVSVDTLQYIWTARAPESSPFALPTSIGWMRPDAADAQLVVVDTKEAQVHLLSQEGEHKRIWELGNAESYPYLAGISGDTIVVLNRGSDELVWWADGRAMYRENVPEGSESALVLEALLATRSGGGEGGPGKLHVRQREKGAVWEEHPIRGSSWRSLGFLRAWGDSVLALSGYRPVVDVLPPGVTEPAPAEAGGEPLDTLGLYGFDSPQLVQSYQFVQGDAKQPPLLTSSARPFGDALYVLNMRGDHVRIDQYDRSGTLQHVFVSPSPWEVLDAFPADLAIREFEGGRDVAVLMQRPSGLMRRADARIEMFRLPE